MAKTKIWVEVVSARGKWQQGKSIYRKGEPFQVSPDEKKIKSAITCNALRKLAPREIPKTPTEEEEPAVQD